KGTMSLCQQVSPLYSPPLPTGSLTTQLGLAARLINANFGVRVINVTYAPFDTTTNQIAAQGNAFTELDKAIKTFFDTLDPAWADAVTLMTWSEFGRRVQFNGTGTDHGTASCLFVMGNKVKGGLYGQQPSLTDLDRNGNLKVQVDYRSVYA